MEQYMKINYYMRMQQSNNVKFMITLNLQRVQHVILIIAKGQRKSLHSILVNLLSDINDILYKIMRTRARARARVCVCVCVRGAGVRF